MFAFITKYVPLTFDNQTPLIVVLVMFGAATLFWIVYGRSGPRPTTPSISQPVSPLTPKKKFIRYRDMILMVVIWIAAVTLGVCVWPFVFKTLHADVWNIGEPKVMFAFGTFAAAVALTFFSIREFFRLLRL